MFERSVMGMEAMPDRVKNTEELVSDMAEYLVRKRPHTVGAAAGSQELVDEMRNIHAAILDAVPHAVIGMKARIIFFANEGVRSVFGWRPEQLIGKSNRVLYRSDEEYEEIARLYYPALETTRTHSGEFPCRHSDGRDIVCRVTAARVGATLKDMMIVATYEDITAIRETERTLRLATGYNRSLLEASPDPLVTVSHEGRITDVNAATEHVTGFSREHLVGTDFFQYFKKPERAREAFHATRQEGSVKDCFLEIKHGQGFTTPVLYSAALYRNEEGAVLGVVSVARDISVRKRMEEALKNANAELERRIEERTEELSQKTRHLEEVNIALKILLQQRDSDRRLLEESVMENVKHLVLPHLEKLGKSRLTAEQATHLEILGSAITSMTSHFTTSLSSMYRNLTPTEIRIADLIRGGRTSKEISEILNTSENTVVFHRHNLRRKMNLKGRGNNLRVFLETLAH